MTFVIQDAPKLFTQKGYEDRVRTERFRRATPVSWESFESGQRYFVPVVVEAKEAGLFPVWCPVLPGVVSQGVTQADAIRNIKEALLGVISEYRSSNSDIPWEKHQDNEEHVWVTVDAA